MCFDFVVISRSGGRVVLVGLIDGCCALRMASRRCLAVGGCQLFLVGERQVGGQRLGRMVVIS